MPAKFIKVSQIKTNRKNPRSIDPAKFEDLKQSIIDFPKMMEIRPVVVDENWELLAGRQRLAACIANGMDKLPFKWVKKYDELSEEEKKKFLVKDNVHSGDWDWEVFQEEEWKEAPIEEWVDMPIAAKVTSEPPEEKEIVVPKKAFTKLGDLYEIGEHRLLCGDSTDGEQITKCINGSKNILVFSDPPYGIEIVSGKKGGGDAKTKFGKVGGEKIVKATTYHVIKGDDTTETARKFMENCKIIGLKDFIIWGGNYFSDFLNPSPCWLIWDKENTGDFADVEMAWTSFERSAKLYKWLWNGMSRKGEHKKELAKRVHPTQKPAGLFVDIFNDFKYKNYFDGFGGSGSTMVSCQEVGSICLMMELDPIYCDVIVKRMKSFDPSLTIKRNGKDISNDKWLQPSK